MPSIINILFFLLTIALTVVMLRLNHQKAILRKDAIANRLNLIQFRHQSDPHSLLNQINSLASLPSRVTPVVMQSKILEFGKNLRHALSYSNSYTTMVAQQMEELSQYAEFQNQKSNNTLQLDVKTSGNNVEFASIPSHILVNQIDALVRVRDVEQCQHLELTIINIDAAVKMSIKANHIAGKFKMNGLSAELLQTQLQYFNWRHKNTLHIETSQPTDCTNVLIVDIIFSQSD